MADEELVKVALQNQGEDVETPWARRVGIDSQGRMLVRLDNIPFLHAKPTYGDVIAVVPDPEAAGRLTWDAEGVAWDEIGTRIHSDGGRYAVIVEYQADDITQFGSFTSWLSREYPIVTEGCFGPKERRPGRLYLAVPEPMKVGEVMTILAGNSYGFRFSLAHPVDNEADE